MGVEWVDRGGHHILAVAGCLWPAAASARSIKEAQAAFDKKQYQEALDLTEQIVKEKGASAGDEAAQDSIRSFISANRRRRWRNMSS